MNTTATTFDAAEAEHAIMTDTEDGGQMTVEISEDEDFNEYDSIVTGRSSTL